MATAPGSESLTEKRRGGDAGDASRAGPCDPQDPQPRVPDDTPRDLRSPPGGKGEGEGAGAERDGAPARSSVA